jgi:sRNA-binding carbon storage regulator CsrA
MGLVLDRKAGQRVRIGDVVVSVDRKCRLLIDAPRDVLILREEVMQDETEQHGHPMREEDRRHDEDAMEMRAEKLRRERRRASKDVD